MSSGYNKSKKKTSTNRVSKNANFSELHTSLILTFQGRGQGYLYSVFILCNISVDTVLAVRP